MAWTILFASLVLTLVIFLGGVKRIGLSGRVHRGTLSLGVKNPKVENRRLVETMRTYEILEGEEGM